MNKYIISVLALVALVLAVTPSFAAVPGAAVKNPNANSNACWGMDRSFYASDKFFPQNMDIKQSFTGDVGEQRRAWVDTYCEPHGQVEE